MKINLGRKLGDIIGPGQPIGPDHIDYPDLYIGNHDDVSLLDIPDKGEATIKFRVVHREHSERSNGNGKKDERCCLRLEVTSIEFKDQPKKKESFLDSARRGAKDL